MEQIKMLRSVEELIFDVAQWPREIVRLLVLSAITPWRAHALVKKEWEKDDDERFKDTMSPILFWLVAVIVPYFLLLDHYLRLLAARHTSFVFVASQPWPVKYFMLALLLAFWPMSSSRMILKKADATKDRQALRRLFCTHCLVLAPASLLLFLSLTLAALFHERARWAQGIVFWTFAAATLYAQYVVVHCEVHSGWWRRVDTTRRCVGKSAFHAALVIMIGGLLIMAGSGVLPP